MGIIRENGVERDFLRSSLYRQGDQVIAKKIVGATKFNTDLLPWSWLPWFSFALVTLVLYYVLLSAPECSWVLLFTLVPFTECFPSSMSFVYIDDGDQFVILLAIPWSTRVIISLRLIYTFNDFSICSCISITICSILKSPDIQSSPAIVFTNCSAILYVPVLFTLIIISRICG